MLCLSVQILHSEECDIETFYKGVDVAYGTLAIDRAGNAIEIETVLIEDDGIKNGRYSITTTFIDDDIYKIENTDYYIKATICFEYVYLADAVLIVETHSGYKMGKIIFIE